MYAITGITGKVGGTLARTLLADGRPVRAVVRVVDVTAFRIRDPRDPVRPVVAEGERPSGCIANRD